MSGPRIGIDFIEALFDKRRLVPLPHTLPWCYHAQLNMKFPSGLQGRGTATLISEDCLITAAHCLYDKEEGGLASDVSVFFGRNDKSFLKKGRVKDLIVHPEYKNDDTNYDFGLLKLDEKIGNELGWARLKHLEKDELKDKEVNVTGYPGTKGPFKTLFNRPTYNMFTMKGKVVDTTDIHKVFYRIDTSGGQSGAGVWIMNKEGVIECIAVHTTGKSPRETGNGAVRITKENYDLIQHWISTFNTDDNVRGKHH